MLFYGCSSLKEVKLSNSITYLGAATFAACTSLESIDLPEGLKTLSSGWTDGVFAHCISLKSITIPASVTYMDYSTFNGCTSLQAIEVEPENTKFSSIDGVLYNKDGTALEKYPIGKVGTTFTIPDSVTAINSHSFTGVNLNEIIIGENVSKIWEYAFDGSTNIKSINIPANITKMGMHVFRGWNDSQTINIEASEIPTGWDNMWNSGCEANIVLGSANSN